MVSDSEIFEFSSKIQQIADEHKLSLLEALIHYQEHAGIESDMMVKLINPAMRVKLEQEAIESNLLKANTSKLPV